MSEIQQESTSSNTVFIKFGFDWDCYNNNDDGTVNPKIILNGKNFQKNIMKVSDKTQQGTFNKLSEILTKYQNFINELINEYKE